MKPMLNLKRLTTVLALCVTASAYSQTDLPAHVYNIVLQGKANDKGTDDISKVCQVATRQSLPIFFPPGVYLFNGPCNLVSGNRLFAKPGSALLKAGVQIDNAAAMILSIAGSPSGEPVTDVRVEGLTLDGDVSQLGNRNNGAKSRLAYVGAPASKIVFSHVAFQNTRGLGISFFVPPKASASAGIANSGVTDSSFSNIGMCPTEVGVLDECAGAAFFSGGLPANNHGNFMKDSHFTRTGLDALDAEQQSHFSATGNTMTLSGTENGVEFHQWRPNAVSHGTFGVACIYAMKQDDALDIEDNQCVGASGNGFDVGGTQTDPIHGLKVIKNTIVRAGGAGLSLAFVMNADVEQNEIHNTYESARWSKYPNIQHQGAISFGCGKLPCSATLSDSNFAFNHITDERNPALDKFGFWLQTSNGAPTVKFVRVQFNGNTFAGVASHYSWYSGPGDPPNPRLAGASSQTPAQQGPPCCKKP